MPSAQSPKTASRLSDSVHHQLNMYALAASAAGVGILALGPSAGAKVVYTPAHKWLPLNQYYYLDLNHDGVNDFTLRLHSSVGEANKYFYRVLTVRWAAKSQSQNAIYAVVDGGFWCAAALPEGKAVGPGMPGEPALWMFDNYYGSSRGRLYFGPWLHITGQQAYLGLQFAINGQVHYGWARLRRIRPNPPIRAELTGYAYETIPNKAIIAGKTKGPDVIRVESATLGRLAQGSAGIRSWRQKESTNSTR